MVDAPLATISGPDLDALFSFAVWTYGTRDEAGAALVAAVRAAPDGGRERWLGRLWRGRPDPRKSGTTGRLQALDDVLRDQMTIQVGLDHPLVRGEPRRLRVLRAEVERACLTAVLRALAPAPRAVLLMNSLFGLSLAAIADITGMPRASVEGSHRKAMRALDDYLGSRCEHLDPRNVCRCAGRIGVALARGFIHWPDHDEQTEHDEHAERTEQAEHDEHAEHAERRRRPGLAPLLASLPRFRPDAHVSALVQHARAP